jgi:septal ring factor EnvC (AmiA/AmiB activator)
MWLLGLCTTIILAGGGAWLGMLQSKVSTLETAQLERGERVAKLEATLTALQSSMERIERKLEEWEKDNFRHPK